MRGRISEKMRPRIPGRMRRRTSNKLTKVSAIRRSAFKGISRRRTREERQRTKRIHRRTRNKDSSEEGFLKLKLGATKNEEIRRYSRSAETAERERTCRITCDAQMDSRFGLKSGSQKLSMIVSDDVERKRSVR